jgi:hypothetical protein
MTKCKKGTYLKQGDRVISPNGRKGVIVLRGEKLKSPPLHKDKFTTIDDSDGLLDSIVQDFEMLME